MMIWPALLVLAATVIAVLSVPSEVNEGAAGCKIVGSNVTCRSKDLTLWPVVSPTVTGIETIAPGCPPMFGKETLIASGDAGKMSLAVAASSAGEGVARSSMPVTFPISFGIKFLTRSRPSGPAGAQVLSTSPFKMAVYAWFA